MGGRGDSGREWPRGGPAGRMTQALRISEVSLTEKGPRESMAGGTGVRGASRGRKEHTEPPRNKLPINLSKWCFLV